MTNFSSVIRDIQVRPITDDAASLKSAAMLDLGVRESDDLLKYFKSVAEFPKPPLRPDSYIRISSIGYMCPREETLAAKLGVTRIEKRPAHKQIIFDIGTVFHTLMQDMFLGPLKALIGDWECAECGHTAVDCVMPDSCPECGPVWRCYSCETHFNASSRPDRCELCGNETIAKSSLPQYRFKEQTVHDKELGIGGHYDGAFLIDEERVTAEFKSIRGDLFAKLTEPYDSHVDQVMLYMYCAGHKSARIIYLNKNFRGANDMHKEYTVPFDQDRFDKLKEKIRFIRDSIEKGDVAPRELCFTKSSYRARFCEMKKECFAKDAL